MAPKGSPTTRKATWGMVVVVVLVTRSVVLVVVVVVMVHLCIPGPLQDLLGALLHQVPVCQDHLQHVHSAIQPSSHPSSYPTIQASSHPRYLVFGCLLWLTCRP